MKNNNHIENLAHLKIVKPKETYNNYNGDVDVYGVGEYLSPFLLDEFLNKDIIPLEINGWSVLNRICVNNATKIEKLCKYNCPYTNLKFWSLVPILLIVEDQQFYRNRFPEKQGTRLKMLFDSSWNRDNYYNYDTKSITRPQPINIAMLGSGYTNGTMIDDGSRSIIIVTLELSNGDKILCYSWEWYNK